MRKVFLIAFVFVTSTMLLWADDEPKSADDLIGKHLESIGSADARAKAKSRGVDGTAHFEFTTRGSGGRGEGSMNLATDGHKFRFVVNLNTPTYTGEDFVSDGANIYVAGLISVGKKSVLGAFVDQRWELLKEGLFGGVLSTGWPLLDVADRKAKIKYNGLKKVFGQELLELRYEPRKTKDDVQIRLYFDPKTYRHVMTIYDARIPLSSQKGTQNPNARISMSGLESNEGHQVLKETFGAFKTLDGIALPSKWTIEMTDDVVSTDRMKWDFEIRSVVHTPVDAAAFKVK